MEWTGMLLTSLDRKWTKRCALVGAHLVITPLSFLWSYGNLAPYLDSYYRYRCSTHGCADGSSDWVLNLFLASGLPGMLCVGRLAKRVGLPWLGLVSTLLCGLALIASSWTVGVSMAASTVLLGAVNGVAMGTGINVAMILVNGWAPEKSSTFTASVTCVPPVLAFIQNQIVTAFVNPRNMRPDVAEHSNAFFSQDEILDRVPEVLLILAGITLGTQVLATLLISNPPNVNTDHGSGSRDSYSTSQAFRSPVFWINSLHMAVISYGLILKNGSVKSFGLLYISDDNLLTALSSVIPLVEVAVRLLFGVLFDRNVLSLKDCLVISLSLNSILFSLFYFAPQVSFSAYLLLILGLSVSHGQLFVLFTVVTLRVFGPDNFAMVYALGFLVNSGAVLLAGGLFTPILQSVGWFGLFITC
ncbi:hypothetical protein EGW08_015117, partial [Elysia chlorotica]